MSKKRIFDLTLSVIGIILFMPILITISLLIASDSKGPVFYKQERVGLHLKKFLVMKFRTMYIGSDRFCLLTVGSRDKRITKIGYWLRKYKIDELPQLFNILKGEMSFVGPRPEVEKYVACYDDSQKRVLTVKPGITDWASIQFIDENQLLENTPDPEQYYIKNILPIKVTQNLKYIDHHNIWIDLKIISFTLKSIIRW